MDSGKLLKLLKVKKSLQACLDPNGNQADAKWLVVACSKAATALDACNLITHLNSSDLETRLEALRDLNVQ